MARLLKIKKEKKVKKKLEQYKFIKEYKFNGFTVAAGVSLKGPYVITDDKLTVENSTVLKDIPLSHLEKFTPVKYTKKRTPKPKEEKKVKKTKSENARISDKTV